MSTSNEAHLHRSLNAEAKANEHNTSDMTYKEFKVESTCHISQSRRYHYYIYIDVCMKVNTRMHSNSVSHK